VRRRAPAARKIIKTKKKKPFTVSTRSHGRDAVVVTARSNESERGTRRRRSD